MSSERDSPLHTCIHSTTQCVLPKPRTVARVAMLFPHETGATVAAQHESQARARTTSLLPAHAAHVLDADDFADDIQPELEREPVEVERVPVRRRVHQEAHLAVGKVPHHVHRPVLVPELAHEQPVHPVELGRILVRGELHGERPELDGDARLGEHGVEHAPLVHGLAARSHRRQVLEHGVQVLDDGDHQHLGTVAVLGRLAV